MKTSIVYHVPRKRLSKDELMSVRDYGRNYQRAKYRIADDGPAPDRRTSESDADRRSESCLPFEMKNTDDNIILLANGGRI